MDIDRDVAALASEQHGVIATRQVRTLGGDRHLTRRRCRAGRWERVTDRVLRIAGAPATPEQRLMIAILDAGPDAIASHEAAAWLWGLPGFAANESVIRPRAANAAPVAGAGHRPVLVPDHHRTVVRGIPCTTLPRTFFDLAATGLHSDRMRQLVNTVITRSPAMLPALHRMLDELACRGRPGITVMRMILEEHPLGSKVPASGIEARVRQIARNAGIRELEAFSA